MGPRERTPATARPPDEPSIGPVLPVGDETPLGKLRVLVFGLATAERRLKWRYKRDRIPVSHAWLPALTVLLHEGEMTAGQFARAAAVTPGSVTPMVEQLESLGLMRRRPDEVDGRVSWISLTASGAADVATLKREWDERWDTMLAGLDDDEIAAANRVLTRVIDLFDATASETGPAAGATEPESDRRS